MVFAAVPARAADSPSPKPNILVILADDLGYGDVRCLNPDRGKIPTPELDRLARQGMVFTDAHSPSSVCTPTRFGLLTGSYAWRTRLKNGVLGGFAPPLIGPDQLTVPALLKQQGYATACIGKWHLGMTWARKSPGVFGDAIANDAANRSALSGVDWSQPILNGPLACGFDSFFGISASLDIPPFAFIRNDRVTEIPTTMKTWKRPGPAAAGFEAEDVLQKLVGEATKEISMLAAGAKAGKPFFLYLALTSPHTPILPGKDWQGKSGLGAYGDFVMQTDRAIGEVLEALEASGAAGSTLVIVTSDNGCSPAAGTAALESQGHFASAGSRGYKSDIWDGGHRIPFLVRWPGVVRPGSRSAEPVCLTDIEATCADILGAPLPGNAGGDGLSIMPALCGEPGAPGERVIVHHSSTGQFAIRQGRWKLALCPGSGGWGKPQDSEAKKNGLPACQLFDMSSDPGETRNLCSEHPETVARLSSLLEKIIRDGRSPGKCPEVGEKPKANNVPEAQ